MMVAVFAEVISRELELGRPEELFTCGVLHNIGILIELRFMEREFLRIKQTAEREKMNFDEAEFKLLGTTHIEIGNRLLEAWGLPSLTRSILVGSHEPEKVDALYYVYACIMNYAEFLVRKLGNQCGCNYGETTLYSKVFETLKISEQQQDAITQKFRSEMHDLVEFVNRVL